MEMTEVTGAVEDELNILICIEMVGIFHLKSCNKFLSLANNLITGALALA